MAGGGPRLRFGKTEKSWKKWAAFRSPGPPLAGVRGGEVSEPPHFLDGSQGLALREASSGGWALLITARG